MKRSALYRFAVVTVFAALLGDVSLGKPIFEVDPNSQKSI